MLNTVGPKNEWRDDFNVMYQKIMNNNLCESLAEVHACFNSVKYFYRICKLISNYSAPVRSKEAQLLLNYLDATKHKVKYNVTTHAFC